MYKSKCVRPTSSSYLSWLFVTKKERKKRTLSRRRRRRRRRRKIITIENSDSMRRNCNLELRLLPAYLSPSDTNSDDRRTEKTSTESPETPDDHPQPLTIFYNGQICVCDVTEFQARAIIMLASREKEERVKTPTAGSGQCSPSVQSSAYSPTAALSMKRSLQRFLQTRKHRAQAMSPYYR